jgi:hypothetical protein
MTDPAGELILYRADDGGSVVQLRATKGTVWLTQAQMLDMILAVGYRVTTTRAVQFRQWATTVLSEYLVKGFAMQDERLKDVAAADYFDELLERIRDIRASEKRFYQKVRDIFATTSADYSGASDTAKTFFATIQNRLHYAVTGQTAGELIVKRADAGSPTMGLTAWRGQQVRKADVTISKNYLTADEISELNRLTTMFLDFAEDRARRRQQILMAEWVQRADAFLTFNERQVLAGAGGILAMTPRHESGRCMPNTISGAAKRRRTRHASRKNRTSPNFWRSSARNDSAEDHPSATPEQGRAMSQAIQLHRRTRRGLPAARASCGGRAAVERLRGRRSANDHGSTATGQPHPRPGAGRLR